jgi:DNA replication protein DnaC
MNGTVQPASIGEVFKKIRDTIPDLRSWPGSDAERALNAEAKEYLASIGIDSSGKRYSVNEVLNAKRRQTACAECGGEPGNIAECAAHGYKTVLCQDDIHIWAVCTSCKVKTAIERQEAIERAIGALPSKLREKSFENFRTDDVSESVKEAFSKSMKAAESGESLILAGSVGAGKTHLAVSLLSNAIHSGRQGLYKSVPSLMNRLRSFGPKGDYQDVLDAAIRCDVLVLDDIGAERCTDWVGEQLYILIDKRYTYDRQTVVTTNFSTPRELITRLKPEHIRKDWYAAVDYAAEVDYTGQRIVSRLCEMGAWITMSGTDRRIRRTPRQKPS